MSRDELLETIRIERERQYNLPGAEWDQDNFPNDWVAIAMSYLSSEVRRKGIRPRQSEFREALIKSAAVIVAALEHLEVMADNEHFESEDTGETISDDPIGAA